jgi:NADPH:quinone reductase-like Zn-dependent oxidoreductase
MSRPAADRENTMKAIVQDKYGSPDAVLELKDIDKPVVKADAVLVRVNTAAGSISDWILTRGVPHIMRMASAFTALQALRDKG